MKKPIEDFHEYIMGDILGHIDDVTSKRMFGGYGLYLDGNIFGIITTEAELYFKVDETNRAEYEAIGSHPFVYLPAPRLRQASKGFKDPKRKPVTMPYWHVPEEIMEDREKIEELVLKSVEISSSIRQ